MTEDPVDALFAKAERAGVRMSEACDLVGIARSTPSRWRHGKSGANSKKIRALSEAIDAVLRDRDGGDHAAGDNSQAQQASRGSETIISDTSELGSAAVPSGSVAAAAEGEGVSTLPGGLAA
ncbi:hypothetical protein [Sphingomonas sp. R1]|uniref:hypothetical protein n=1 Tax=Sphingomonas sp. R1 TaxID=399176 RepID=UPI00222551B5|nr:hypothetical protein [Sphingomonas sp. R1]UYY77772.1 hypothetical protein OIM94_01835 [Sphingomonas sp. R1]